MVSQFPTRAWFSCVMSDSTNNPPGDTPYGQQSQPPAYGGSGQQPYSSGYQPYGQQPYGAPSFGGGDPDKRPGTVTAAGIITIVMSSLGLLLFGIALVALIAARDDVIDEIDTELADQPGMEDITGDDLANFLIAVLLIFVIWCLIAIVTGVLSLRRQNWARIVTVISAAMTALISLVAIMSGISAISLIAGVAVIVLYFTGGANDWYSRKKQSALPPPGAGQWG